MIEFIKHINFFEWLKFYKTSEKDDFNKNYRPVEYLQSDGNQYIITPFYYDVGDIGTPPIYNIKCRCCINDNYSIFGIYRAFNLTGSSGKMRFYGYTDRQNLLTDINTGTELNNWELLNKNLYCNGIIQNTTPDYFNNTYGFGGGDYIYLFGRAGLDDNGGNCKISNFYVSAKDPDTGTITEICDLVACIRKSDNKPGMYDKVSQTFLTNQGTGDFTVPIYGYLSGNPPFTFNSNGNSLVDYTISGNTVQSDTPTPDNPIMPQGTGERTGNLFDTFDIVGQVPSISSGALVNSISGGCTSLIPISSAEITMAITNGTAQNNYYLFLYGDNENYIGYRQIAITSEGTVVSTKISGYSSAKYARIRVDNLNTHTTGNFRIMLAYGTTAQSFEPYGYKIPISSANITTPVYLGEAQSTRNIRKLVLTGNEEITSVAVTGGLAFLYNPTPYTPNQWKTADNVLSSHYKSEYSNNDGNIYFTTTRLAITDFACSTIDEFKAYLAEQFTAGTPVTVWYVLANEETGIVNEPLMKIGDYADTVSKAQAGVEIPTINGSNTLTVDTTLQPSEVSIVYKK